MFWLGFPLGRAQENPSQGPPPRKTPGNPQDARDWKDEELFFSRSTQNLETITRYIADQDTMDGRRWEGYISSTLPPLTAPHFVIATVSLSQLVVVILM